MYPRSHAKALWMLTQNPGRGPLGSLMATQIPPLMATSNSPT